MNTPIEKLKPYSVEAYQDYFASFFSDAFKKDQLTLVERLNKITEKFLDKPYLNGALGEGPSARFDQSPLFRDDAFDCLTFVNTALALLSSRNWEDFEVQMLKLNYYDGLALYQKRFHFMSCDWNIENARHGIIRDITAEILEKFDGSKPTIATALIDKPNWFLSRTLKDIKQLETVDEKTANSLLKELHDLSQTVSAIESHTPYIPFDKLFDKDGHANLFLFAKIPPGSIVEIVRPNWALRDKIGTNLNISHLGFVFYNGTDLIFRHATILQKKVTQEPLIDYLRNNCLGNPTIQGVNVQAVLA